MDTTKIILDQKKEKNKYEQIEQKVKESFFYLIYFILKNQDVNVWTEIFVIVIELLQLLAYPFSLFFSSAWKKQSSFEKISYFFKYFQLIPFFEDNEELYVITFYFCVLLMILVIFLVVFYSVYLSKHAITMFWPLKLLRNLLKAISTFFFIPLAEMFLCTLKCVNREEVIRTFTTSSTPETDTEPSSPETGTRLRNLDTKVNYINPTIECYEGLHLMHLAFGIIFGILLFFTAYLVKTTLFDAKMISSKPNTKFTSYNDKMMLVVKILTCLLFNLFGTANNQWILTIFLLLFSVILVYLYIDISPNNNPQVSLLNMFSLITFFWGNIILVICMALKSTSFDGGISLFFIGIPIICAILYTLHQRSFSILLMQIVHAKSGIKILNKIRLFMELTNKKDVNRKSSVILKGYIHEYEATCQIKNCALKKYLECEDKKEEGTAFLLQHIEYMFQLGLSKFPTCTLLRILYSFFLMDNLNKKQQASKELLISEKYCHSLEEEFIIFRAKKIIEEQTMEIGDNAFQNYSDDKGNNDSNNIDLLTSIAYKKYLATFKNLINKTSLLYIDFWSLLLNPNQDSKHLTKLNDFGTKINLTVEELRNIFDKIQKIKHNDKEVIYYYSDFLNDILNDKEEAMKLKMIIEAEDTKQPYDDSNYFNLDLTALSSSDEYQYIIVSGKTEIFGTITNISLGVCLILGFTRNELIGKNYDVIIPEIFQKSHREILKEKVSNYKKDAINVGPHKNSKSAFRDVHTYVKNKARYLVPLLFKVALINTETNGISFVAKVYTNNTTNTNNNPVVGSMNFTNSISGNPADNKSETTPLAKGNVCYILTNNFLIIQNFTSNAISLLGLNSDFMKSTMEISGFIKQFHEDILKYMVTTNDNQLTPDQKISIKRQILKTKFKNACLINWKNNEYEAKKQKLDSNSPSHPIDETLVDASAYHSNLFYLTVKDAIIGNTQEGYVFVFEEATSSDPPGQGIQGISSSFRYTAPKKNKSKKNLPAPKNDANNFDLTSTFIPNSETQFQFDSTKIAFKVNPQNSQELRNAIKAKAFEKLNTKEEKKSETQSEEEEEESEEDSSSGSGDENLSNSENISSSNKTDDKNQISENSYKGFATNYKKPANNDDGAYYKVNMSNIKLMVYNYRKKMLEDKSDFPKMSQVEMKKLEGSGKNVGEDESSEKNDSLEKTRTPTKPGDNYLQGNPDQNNLDPNNPNNADKKAILIKQIEYSLSKKESQPSITKLMWFSFLVFVVLIGVDAALIYEVYYSFRTIKENFTLIKNSYGLITNSLYSISNVRELMLLSFDEYNSFLKTKEEDIKMIVEETNSYYFESHELVTYIITSFLSLTAEHNSYLYDNLINITVLKEDLNVNNYLMPLANGFIETNTAIFHITNDTVNNIYLPTNIYVFFFMENTNNGIMMGLEEQAQIFVDEINVKIKWTKGLMIYTMVGVFALLTGSYFLMSLAYGDVAKRKESYLEVFFEIGTSVIKGSLEKCEKFTKKIQSETFSEFLSNSSDDNEGGDSEALLFTHSGSNDFSGSQDKRGNSHYSHNRFSKNSRETVLIKIYLGIFLFGIFILNVIVVALLLSCTQKVKKFVLIYKNQFDSQVKYLKIYNYLREYLFDENQYIEKTPIKQTIDNYTNHFFSNVHENEKIVFENKNNFPNKFNELYMKIYHQNLCEELDFGTESNCNEEMFNATKFGLNVLLSSFVEEIRSLKTERGLLFEKKALQQGNFYFNCTTFGYNSQKNCTVEKEDSSEITDDIYQALNPFQLFNKNEMKNLKQVYYNYIKPAFSMLYTEMNESVLDYINLNTYIYIGVLGGYGGLILIFYFFIWKPFEIGLKNLIFKTKNMLGIIPKEVLASLGNIQKLLGINQNLKQNNGLNMKKT